MTNPLTNKVLVLGIDGMDPSLTGKFLHQGLLPNIQKLLERGAAREDLALLGGVPTITPPMWTTLSTGAYPFTHGITCFWAQSHENLDGQVYALDSRLCKAEQMWDVLVRNGKKTLVWHWPGSSWPPTCDSPLLHVVDGTQPAMLNMGVAIIDNEKILEASVHKDSVLFNATEMANSGAGCILTDVQALSADDAAGSQYDSTSVANRYHYGTNAQDGNKEKVNIMFTYADGEGAVEEFHYDKCQSTLKPAAGWQNAAEGAQEFYLLTGMDGSVQRPCLALKNEQGVYDRIAVYQNKNAPEPLVIVKKGEIAPNLVTEVRHKEESAASTRSIALLDIDEDGSYVKLWISAAIDIHNSTVWHPTSLMDDVYSNVGYQPCIATTGGKNLELCQKLQVQTWDIYAQWQARALKYLINAKQYEVVFSHLHNLDAMGHNFLYLCCERPEVGNDPQAYQQIFAEAYSQTDRYIGEFLDLLDEGWTIFVVSDHGLLCQEHEIPMIGDNSGVNVRVMEALGYTAVLKDKNGNDIKAIDWSKTRAVANRGNHIYINLKGRYQTGIVEPKEKDALVEQIISDLYAYRDPTSGERVIELAMKNKNAAILGLGGPECGDILYWVRENYNRIHGDSLPTFKCHFDASVSPIFMAAGRGIKQNVKTERVIREVDLAPTIAMMMGMPMPAQCEGAPVYQILDTENI